MADGRIIIDTEVNSSGAERGISELSKKAHDGLGTMNKAFLATSAAIGGIGAYAIKVGGDFEEGMSKVQAISGATGSEIEQLSTKAKEMGAKTKFSATESAEAMQYMAMAGWKTGDMLNGIDGIMNLAAASGEDLALVSDIVTDALTAFGLQASDSAHFADLLASAASNSNTNVSMLGESFKYVAPVAGALGHSAQDTAFALGLMANAGIKGTQSGTSLRASLTNLAHPSKQMSAEMKKLGISLTDSNGKVKEGKTLYDELRQKFSGLTDAQKTQSAATIFGKEAMSGMLAIINASDEDYKKLYESLSNCDGVAEEMANTMNDNLKGSLTLLGSAVEGVGIAFYEKFSGPAKKAVDNVAEWFSNLTTKLSNGELDNTLSGIATALAAVGTGLLVFNVITIITNFIGVMNGTATAIGLVAKAQGVWNAVMAMSPIGWITIAISALVAGIVVLWNTNDGFREAVIGAWNTILSTGQSVWGWLVNFFTVDIPNAWNGMIEWFGSVGNWFVELWESIKQAFVDGWNSIVSFFTESIPNWWQNMKQSFADGWQAIVQFFTESVPALIEAIFNWFNELPYKIGYALGYVLGTIVKWGVDTWNYLSTNVPIWIKAVVDWFASLPGKIWTWLLNTISKVVQWGKQTYSNMVSAVTKAINVVVKWFSTLPGKIWSWLTTTINKIVAWGQQTYTNMVNSASNAINAVVQWFSKLPGRIWTWLSNTIKKAIIFKNNLGKTATEAGTNMVTNIIGAVKDLPSKFMAIGINIVKGVWNGITSMGSWIADKVSGFFTGIVDGAKDALGIHSPSRVFRDQVGKYMAQGVGVGFSEETDNIKKSMVKNLSKLTAKMQMTVGYETAKTSRAMTSGVNKNNSNVITNNNDNGITQNVTIVNPERTPSENARALKKVGRDLAFGY